MPENVLIFTILPIAVSERYEPNPPIVEAAKLRINVPASTCKDTVKSFAKNQSPRHAATKQPNENPRASISIEVPETVSTRSSDSMK
jgi:hypothetical protein